MALSSVAVGRSTALVLQPAPGLAVQAGRGLGRCRRCARCPVWDLRPWRGGRDGVKMCRVTDFARPAVPEEFTRLDREESLRLLADVPVGRLIFTVNALPTMRRRHRLPRHR